MLPQLHVREFPRLFGSQWAVDSRSDPRVSCSVESSLINVLAVVIAGFLVPVKATLVLSQLR
jgi:hypothetical protein